MTNIQDIEKSTSLLIDNNYFPNVNWFKNSIKFSYLIFSSYEKYRKMTFRNRCVVVGSNGLVQLSVPIADGRNQKIPFKDVRIASNSWQKHHWLTLRSCYGRSPYFEHYADYFQPYFEKRYTFLFDLNMEIVKSINKIIGINQEVIDYNYNLLTHDYPVFKEDLPKNFQEKTDIRYPQLFEDRVGFQPNVSILDLLFMEGPNTREVLLSK